MSMPVPPTSRRTVAYLRVSTEEQALDGYSLADQERRARDAAGTRGQEIAAVYVDHHTGKSRNRPALLRLLRDVAAGAVGTIIITEIDRLARRASHALAIDEEIRRFGAGCVFLDQNIDTTTDNGKLMFTIYAGIAEYERTQILKRTRNGRAQKAREGNVSRPERVTPYGYRYLPQSQRADYEMLVALGQEPAHVGGWVIIEREAAVVRRIFEAVAAGQSVGAVCAALNRDGIPTKRGGPWRHATVWAMLHRSHLWGQATHGYSRRVEVNDDTSASRKNPDPSEVIVIPVPAIVTEELARRAQEQCHRNMSRAKRNARHDYLLGGGLLRCGECAAEGYLRDDGLEYAMGGKMSSAQWRHYRCLHGRHRAYAGDRPSSHHAVTADHIETLVWEKLCDLMADPASVLEHHAALSGAHEGAVRTLDADLSRLEGEIAALEARRSALLDLVGRMDNERLVRKDAEFAAQQDALTRRRADLLAERARAAGAILPLGSVRQTCARVYERMRTATFEQRRVLVQHLVSKIVVTRRRYLMHCVLVSEEAATVAQAERAGAPRPGAPAGATLPACGAATPGARPGPRAIGSTTVRHCRRDRRGGRE